MPSTKQFDVDEALDRAMEAFWERGFEATSMTELLGRMGIQKGSFYATFSSKHAVYLQAFEHYVSKRFRKFEAEMDGLPPLAAIEKMFELVQGECGSSARKKGCLVINAALELAPSDPDVGRIVRKTLSYHEKLLTSLIQKGKASGEIAAHIDDKQTSKALLGLIISMRVYSRAGMPAAYAASLRTQAMSMLE